MRFLYGQHKNRTVNRYWPYHWLTARYLFVSSLFEIARFLVARPYQTLWIAQWLFVCLPETSKVLCLFSASMMNPNRNVFFFFPFLYYHQMFWCLWLCYFYRCRANVFECSDAISQKKGIFCQRIDVECKFPWRNSNKRTFEPNYISSSELNHLIDI